MLKKDAKIKFFDVSNSNIEKYLAIELAPGAEAYLQSVVIHIHLVQYMKFYFHLSNGMHG